MSESMTHWVILLCNWFIACFTIIVVVLPSVLVIREQKAKQIKKLVCWRFESLSLPNDSCSKIALNLCRATESRWKRNCPSLPLAETEVILWLKSFKNCATDSSIGSRVSKAISWNMYDPDNAACLAVSAAAPAEDAEAEMYESARVVAIYCSIAREEQTSLPSNRRQTVRAFAVTTKETRRFLRDWKFG